MLGYSQDIDPAVFGLVGVARGNAAGGIAPPLRFLAAEEILGDRNLHQRVAGIEQTHVKGLSLSGDISAVEGTQRSNSGVQAP